MYKKTSAAPFGNYNGVLEIVQYVLKTTIVWERLIRFGESPNGFGFSVFEFATGVRHGPSENIVCADWCVDTGLSWGESKKIVSPLCSCGFCGSLFEGNESFHAESFLNLFADIEFSFLHWDEASCIRKFEELYLSIPETCLFKISRCPNCSDDDSFLDHLHRRLSESEFDLWQIKPDAARKYVDCFAASGDLKRARHWERKLGVVASSACPAKQRPVRRWSRREAPVKQDAICGVYCIESGGLIKIGLSTNIKTRLSSIRGANPTAKLLRVIQTEDVKGVERQMHMALACKNYDREWFSASEDDFVNAASGLGYEAVKITL